MAHAYLISNLCVLTSIIKAASGKWIIVYKPVGWSSVRFSQARRYVKHSLRLQARYYDPTKQDKSSRSRLTW